MSSLRPTNHRSEAGSLRAPTGSSDRLVRYLTFALAAAVVATLLLLPLLSGSSPKSPDSAAARTYVQPFREAFAGLMWWLQLAKWVSAGMFILVVAVALLRRARFRNTAPSSIEDPDQREPS